MMCGDRLPNNYVNSKEVSTKPIRIHFNQGDSLIIDVKEINDILEWLNSGDKSYYKFKDGRNVNRTLYIQKNTIKYIEEFTV